ncbi:MAG: alpha/beta hydrolase [Planctomycetaceae bacterium]
MSFHYDLTPLIANEKVSIKWSKSPRKKAILFVHGYGGNTTGTWTEFDRLLSDEEKAAGYDLIFYGYDGLRGTIYFLATDLRSFLTGVFGAPADLKTETSRPPELPAMDTYEEVIVVAHSLGAVISRWALAMAVQLKDSWVGKTSLALFAPAHNGSRPAAMLRLGSSGMPFLRFFVAGFLHSSPLVDELAEGSSVLQDFRAAVTSALADPARDTVIADLVVHANKERVVINRPFEQDPPPAFPELFRDADHLSVCKPTRYFPAPLIALRSILR